MTKKKKETCGPKCMVSDDIHSYPNLDLEDPAPVVFLFDDETIFSNSSSHSRWRVDSSIMGFDIEEGDRGRLITDIPSSEKMVDKFPIFGKLPEPDLRPPLPPCNEPAPPRP